jgi:predicted nicotinamide N-methyase
MARPPIVHEVAGLRLASPDVDLGRRSVFAHLWPAGVVLAEQLAGALGDGLAGRRVIELGCGLGACGLAAARRGARVVLTDSEPEALALVERNARGNRLDVETRALPWGAVPDELRGAFDVVLGADVTYDPRTRPALLATIAALRAPTGVAWLADPGRTSRRELMHHTNLAVMQWARYPAPAGLATSDGMEDRDVILYRLSDGALC